MIRDIPPRAPLWFSLYRRLRARRAVRWLLSTLA